MNTIETFINNSLPKEASRYYGIDLTTKFASEIAQYSDVWSWIYNRAYDVNFQGLNVGDYIPFTMSDSGSTVIKAQIAGFNIDIGDKNKLANSHSGNSYIDFISKDCYPQYIQWNTTETNAGTTTQPNPFLASNVCSVLNSTIYGYLPAALKEVIIVKDFDLLNAITDLTTIDVGTLPNLWLPTEVEVFGSAFYSATSTSFQSTSNTLYDRSVHYPLFANKSRIKSFGNGSSTNCSWWLLNSSTYDIVVDGNTFFYTVCAINSYGAPIHILSTDSSTAVPICFRIGYRYSSPAV